MHIPYQPEASADQSFNEKISSEHLSPCLREFVSVSAPLLASSPRELADKIAGLPGETQLEVLGAFREITSLLAKLSPLQVLSNPQQEATRLPLPSEPRKIAFDRITVLLKESKIEFDMRIRGVSFEQLVNAYEGEGVKVPDVFSAHVNHNNTLIALRRAIPQAKFQSINLLSDQQIQDLIAETDLVVSVGGDDTLKQVARYVKDEFVLSINSDPQSSHGALCSFDVNSFIEILPALESGDFQIEEWSRLSVKAKVAGQGEQVEVELPPALSEVVIAEDSIFHTMRGTVELAGERRKMKGSGIVIASGAGSTGWLAAVRKHIYPLGRFWPRTDKRIEFGHMMSCVGQGEQLESGELKPGEVLTYISSGNRRPMISGDSTWFQPFPRGSVATITLSDTPLKMIAHPRE